MAVSVAVNKKNLFTQQQKQQQEEQVWQTQNTQIRQRIQTF